MNQLPTSNTSFGKLTKVLVGRETKFPKVISDFSFKHFYGPALNQEIYDAKLKYKISHELSIQRNEDLDKMAITLQQQGIEVYRPVDYTKPVNFKTPEYESTISPANNVRDITLVYNDTIIETPTFVRNRYFENIQLEPLFQKLWQESNFKLKWIRAPHQILTEETMDLEPYNKERNFVFGQYQRPYAMAIDGAQYLRIGKDVIVNITSYNHWFGAKWIESFFPESRFWYISVVDNHIDGLINCLRPGTFLVNPNYPKIKDILPKHFHNWEYLIPEKSTRKETSGTSLASIDGMDVNILSLDINKVMVKNNSYEVLKLLEKHQFDIVPVELNHCELFGGGVHCSTLDLAREGEHNAYTTYF